MGFESKENPIMDGLSSGQKTWICWLSVGVKLPKASVVFQLISLHTRICDTQASLTLT